jgi:ECF transporter S component (folate family)
MRLKDSFAQSAKELKKTRSLAVAAMLLAIAVVLGFFSVQLTESIRISFTFLANELTGMLFGPVVGMLEGGLADIVNYMIKPTGPFFPGFTISGILGGLIYGMFLYKKPLTLRRIILTNSLVTVFVNMLLNTYWLTLLYGNAYLVILPARIVKELILLPINVAMFWFMSTMLTKAKVFKGLEMPKQKALAKETEK